RLRLPEPARVQVQRRKRRSGSKSGPDHSFEFLVSSFRRAEMLVLPARPKLETRNLKLFVVGQRPKTNDQGLLAVQLDNQLLVDRQLNIFTLGQRQNSSLVVVAINLQPVRKRL